jgi:hypothetical protein
MSSLVAKVRDTRALANLPRIPVSDSGTTEPKTIVFSQMYLGIALDLMIENKDPTNTLDVTINKQKTYTLAASGVKTWENQVIDIVEIVPHPSTGAWYLDAGLVDIWLFKKVTGA